MGSFVTPPQIRPQAFAYSNANQSIPNNAETAITFNALLLNTGGGFNLGASSTRWTNPVFGLYAFIGQVRIAGAAGGTKRVLSLRQDGGFEIYRTELPPSANPMTIQVVGQAGMVVGSYVELTLIQDSGAALNSLTDGLFLSPSMSVARL